MSIHIKPCPVCGKPADLDGNLTCGHKREDTKAMNPPPAPKPSTRDRRHNYRTDGIPPQKGDKHVDEPK